MDRWFRTVRLPMTVDQFWALPQHPAYKYEYLNGHAWLSPRPKSYHARLDLPLASEPPAIAGDEPVALRPLAEGDWEHLASPFANAFHRVPPFCVLNDDDRRKAAAECLGRTRAGADGDLVPGACFVAESDGRPAPVGAILVTLTPERYLRDFEDDAGAPPEGPLPHLTWIFVAPWFARLGVGSTLLAAAASALHSGGHRHLASTFLLGNESSMLWHWRCGFRLLPYLASPRHIDRRVRRLTQPQAGPPAGGPPRP